MKFKIIVIFLLTFVSITPFAKNSQESIEIVVPYTPGAVSDNLGRLVAKILTDRGYPSTVVNKPGASTIIGVNYVSDAAPTGNTLLVTSIPSLTSNTVFKADGIKYDQTSFIPVVSLGKTGMLIVASKNVPVDNYFDFIKYIKTNPEKFNVGVWSMNTASIVYEWAQRAGLPKPAVILYKGSAPLINDVLGNQIQFGFDTVSFNVPQISDNKLTAIVAFDRGSVELIKKINSTSKVISISTQYPELEVNEWYYAVLTPRGTLPRIVNKINLIINKGLAEPKNQEILNSMHLQNYGGSSELISTVTTTNLKRFQRIKKTVDID
jgi:tripartite-type tricarboxylate transporter receptor subunit TctC